MYKVNSTDIFLSEQIQKGKENLKLKFQENFTTQEKTLEWFVKGINHANFNGFVDTKFIWNIATYINIVSFDFKIVGHDLFFATNEWHKRFYARQACLIMYESVNDLFDLLGKDLKKLLSEKINTIEIEKDLKSIKADLNQFKLEHFEPLKTIRNNAIAHRDLDSITQLNSIINISWSDTIEIVNKFDNILNRLGSVMQQIINIGLVNFEELKRQK